MFPRWNRRSRSEYNVDDNELRTDWKSISVHTHCIGPGVWPYMKLQIPDITENFYGIISSLNSVGIVIAAPIAGWASNQLEDTKLPMLCGKIFAIISCILYMLIEVVGVESRRFFFITFMLILGFAVGAANTYRTHVAMASTEADRPKAVGVCSFAPSLGIAIGPLIQIAFTAIGYPGIKFLGVHMNLFTVPVIMTILISLIGAFLLMFCFNGRYKQLDTEKPDSEEESSTANLMTEEVAGYDKVAFFVCLYTKVLINYCVLNFNVVGIPYAMMAYLWSSEKSVLYLSICSGLIGVNICLLNLAYVFLDLRKRLSERRAIVISIAGLLLSYLLTYPWPFISERIPYQNLTDNSTEPLGCKREFGWCATTPLIDMWIFLGSLIIVLGFAYPLCLINLDILFSKVLGNIKQGTLQSYMICCGEILSIFGPILFTRIYTISGPTYIWQFAIAVLCISFVIWVIFYKRMVGKSRLTQVTN